MSKYSNLVAKHGTLKEFTEATQNAVGDMISQDEADAAIKKYVDELIEAAHWDAAKEAELTEPEEQP